MNLSKHERRYKTYLEYQKKYDEVWDEIRSLPWTPIAKPYQDGWEVYIDVRDDIKSRKDYSEIKEMIEMCYSSQRCRDVKVIRRIRKTNGFRDIAWGEKKWRGWLPIRNMLPQYKYEQLEISKRKWFSKDSYSAKWSSFKGFQYFLDIPYYWMILKVKPYIVTHTRDKNPKLESELKFLRGKLQDMWIEFGINYSSSYPAYKDRAKTRDKIQKFKKGEIEDIEIEKIPKEYDY